MKKLTLFLVALTMILFSCKPEIEKPTVATKSVGEITKTTATVSGDVTSDGGAEVSERGVCWNTEGAPTILDSRTKDGTGIGSFTSNLSDLTPQTTYYVRTYATNEAGTAYGEEKTFTTLADEPEQPGDEPEQPGDEPEEPEKPEDPKGLPVVITGEVGGIGLTYAYCDGEVISSGMLLLLLVAFAGIQQEILRFLTHIQLMALILESSSQNSKISFPIPNITLELMLLVQRVQPMAKK